MVGCNGVVTLVCLGEADMVVAAVVAVLGLSADDIAAAEDCGSFPVSSSLRILDFKSSNSSQTVEGAAVETDDSVVFLSPYFGRSTYPESEKILVFLRFVFDRCTGRIVSA